jgi:hypothetical protein
VIHRAAVAIRNEGSVVRSDETSSREGKDGILEGTNGIQIQVIGGLIKKQ